MNRYFVGAWRYIPHGITIDLTFLMWTNCKTRDIGRRHCLESKPKPDSKLTNHISSFLLYANHSHTPLRANNWDQGTANVRRIGLEEDTGFVAHFNRLKPCIANQPNLDIEAEQMELVEPPSVDNEVEVVTSTR